MTSIELDMIQTAGIGALALLVGMVLTRKVAFLQRFCIPSPVSGGIIFSLLTLALYGWFHVEVSFDGTLRDVFMLAFFTSVGYQSDLKVLKQGGKALAIMLVLLVLIITLQNLMPLGITKLMGVDSLLGITAGSVSMTGGHGTAGGFAEVLESMGLEGAGTIGMAAATFGLIAGSMLGGPLSELIIRKKLTQEQMQPQDDEIDPAMAGIESDEASPEGRAKRISSNEQEFQQYAKASYWMLLYDCLLQRDSENGLLAVGAEGRFAEMLVCQRCGFSTARCTFDESFLDEIGFIDILDGARIFSHGGSDRIESDGSATELIDDGQQQFVIYLVESESINIQRLECILSDVEVDSSVPFDLRKVSHAAK
jgi:hypothetical protein